MCLKAIHSEIKRINSADWAFVVDVDEFLLPVCKRGLTCKDEVSLCDFKQPTLFYRVLQDVLRVAQYRILDGHSNMTTYKATKFERCPFGYSPRANEGVEPWCERINGISLPSRFWVSGTSVVAAAAAAAIGDSTTVKVTTTASGLGEESLPSMRSKFIVHYGSMDHINKTAEETVSRAQAWKTMHHVSSSPPLTGHGTAHLGVGFSVLAPRRYHARGWTMEIAHLREEYNDKVIPLLLKDDSIEVLVKSFRECSSESAV